ncbi:YigZ family protein [Mycoplasma phocoeninasale]|uniref:YigZ family protein n=1 Tax=Mycoplasma phocoeninasale TaxID=2726117 RepID=A0A858U2H2_9MOLU|nr:YigZ family protein [Mycoplasma phocoeninasale]MBN0970860.1 YigZ family protein [Mycoplasma phocoeninasale]QJG66151.1 YigZ family protein [Mycoplasma phocoeninasale]
MKIYEIKKSKFIGYLLDVKSVEDIKNKINDLRTEHKKARHVVYAYKFTDSNNQQISSYTDDKEPKGVAGIPLMMLINNKKISNKAIVIIRYFGGIELGKSRLLRAYLHTAKLVLENE